MTPYLPAEIAAELFIPRFRNRPPLPILFVGHFNDPRAAQCRPVAQQRCLDRLVVERLVQVGG